LKTGTIHAGDVQSPLKVYLDHLERGELAYQFSLAAGRPVFFPACCVPSPAATGRKMTWCKQRLLPEEK
jgi:hypothetical protein